MTIVLSGAVSATTQNNTTCSDPIINGTVTISEYGNVRPLPNATITVNSTGSNSRVLGTTTTDANGYYSINFYSVNTQFLVTASYLGCNSVTKTVNVSQSSNPQDPNYYGTSNIQLTPKTATWNGQMGYYSSIYITYYDGYYSAGELKTSISGDSATYNAYCIDIYTTIHSGGQLLVNGPLPGTTGDLSDQVDWDKVNYIISHYAANSNLEGAAIQAAIWYFTSAQYGEYPGNDPSHPGYYQFMTNPEDAKLNTWYNPNAVRDRAWEIINSANSMNYPSTVTLEPEITRVENGSDVVITATVRDQNGNPLQNITVNFTTDKGNLSYATRTTNANGQASVTLYNVGDNSTATVTAYVTGKYGTLLYDDVNNPLQNLVCAQLLPYTLSDTSTINFDRKVDVQITQTVDKPVANVGDIVNFTITARNTHGYRNATGIIIKDIIPEGLSNVTVIPSVGTFYNNLWVIPSLASGATATLNIIGTVTASMAGLTVTNTATRVGQDQYNSLPAIASASVYTKMAMVDIDETVNTPVNVGDTVTYVVSVTNNGPDTATNIVVEDNPPCCLNNLTITPSVGTYENGIWTIPSLASGATATLTISGIATAVMAGCCTPNTATIINQTEYDPHTIGESVTKETYTKEANVALSQTANYQGNVVTFTVTATNNGPDTATNINITDLIPAGFTNVTVTPSIGTYENGIWIIPSLENGVVATLTITGTAVPQSTITNTVTKTGQTEYDPATQDTVTNILYVPGSDLRVNNYIYNGPNLATPYGSAPLYTIVAVNNSTYMIDGVTYQSDDATGVKVNIIIPEGLEFVSASPRQGTYDAATHIWTIGDLPRGAYAYLDLVLKVIGFSDTNLTITNNATISGDQYDPILTNNYKTYDITVIPPADIEVKYNSSDNNPNAGDNVILTVRTVNNGPVTATGVKITNKLPAGLLYQSHEVSWDGGSTWILNDDSYNPGNGIWDLSSRTMDSGTSCMLRITATVEGSGTITTEARKTAQSTTQLDYNISNNSQKINLLVDSVKDSSTSAADLRVNNYIYNGPNLATPYGSAPLYTIVAVNNSTYMIDGVTYQSDDATGVKVNIIIPEGLEFVSASPRQGTYDAATHIWTIGDLPRGAYAYLDLVLKVIGFSDTNLTITNNATISGDQYDPILTNNYKTYDITVIPPADIQINNTVDNINPSQGDTVIFEVEAKNNGPVSANGVVVTYVIPSGLTYQSHEVSFDGGNTWISNDSSYNPSTGAWDLTGRTMTNGETYLLRINVTVTGTGHITTEAAKTAQSSTQFDYNISNNRKRESINVIS